MLWRDEHHQRTASLACGRRPAFPCPFSSFVGLEMSPGDALSSLRHCSHSSISFHDDKSDSISEESHNHLKSLMNQVVISRAK